MLHRRCEAIYLRILSANTGNICTHLIKNILIPEFPSIFSAIRPLLNSRKKTLLIVTSHSHFRYKGEDETDDCIKKKKRNKKINHKKKMAKTSNKKPSKNTASNHPNAALAMTRIAEEDENKRAREPDEEMNSGFANYLRSGEGIQTNTIYQSDDFQTKQSINLT